MDAFDIFKKISRGCTFSRRPKPPQDNSEEKSKSDSVNCDANTLTEDTAVKKGTVDHENSITLISGMENIGAKGKKRKACSLDKSEIKKKKRLIEQEEVNHYRNVHNISVVGNQIPNPAHSFDEFEIDNDLIENLKNCGYENPTPIQQQAVPVMLKEREILACAPTGSGKTAAFLLPIIQTLKGPKRQGFRALILCPTRELASQTQRESVKLSDGRGFRVHVISKINKALSQYGSNSNKKYDILITTPNRLCFLLKQDPPAINLSNVQYLIIDEADKLFEDGARSFRKQLMQILHACDNKNRKIAMFSATSTPIVAKWCKRNMSSAIKVYVGHKNAATDTVDQQLLFVGTEQGKLLAFRNLIRDGLQPPVLIFVQSKERAQQLFKELIYDGINVDAIHSDRTQTQRQNTVRAFREGHIWILICTELMARGIDFKGVNLVINYDFPPSSISYVHRIGRAGRAGRKGKAITFFTTEDRTNLRSIAHKLIEAGCDVPKYMLTLKKKHKSDIKKLARKAPERDEITTTLLYDRIEGGKKKKFSIIKKLNKSKEVKESLKTTQKKKNFNSKITTNTKPVKKKNTSSKIAKNKKATKQKKTLKKNKYKQS